MKSKKFGKAIWDSVTYSEDKQSLLFDDPALRYLSEEQAKEWLRFGTFTNIHTLSGELEILTNNLPKALPKNSKITLIDLGCGDGIGSTQTMRLLYEHNLEVVAYYAIDINQTLINTTATRVCTLGGLPVDRFHGYCTRFESLVKKGNLPWRVKRDPRDNSIVLLLFLGNTFNNFEPKEIVQLLEALVLTTDKTLIGVKVRPSIADFNQEQIVNEYQSFGEAFSFSFGHLLGLRDEEMHREVLYNSAVNRAEIWIHPSKVIIPPTMPDIRATKLLVFKSYRPTIEEMQKQLKTFFSFECWQSEHNDDVVFYCTKISDLQSER